VGTVTAVCVSKIKGTSKEPIAEGVLVENYGLVGDAHASQNINRQVSLLAMESINKMKALKSDIGPGDFAENITCEGVDPFSLLVGTRVLVGKEIILEISQIGKECHTSGCAIYREIGKCIMPKEGLFARVIRGGVVRAGDEIREMELIG
jgi:molybdopterin adenylyltransferase